MVVASCNPPHVWFVLYLCVHMYVQLSIGCLPQLRDFQGSQEPPFKYKATINLKQNSAMLYKRMNYTAATCLLSFWYTIEESLCLYLHTVQHFPSFSFEMSLCIDLVIYCILSSDSSCLHYVQYVHCKPLTPFVFPDYTSLFVLLHVRTPHTL